MRVDRPAKVAVRKKWLETVQARARNTAGSAHPIYLTLPGAEGKDRRDADARDDRLLQRRAEQSEIPDSDRVALPESRQLHRVLFERQLTPIA